MSLQRTLKNIWEAIAYKPSNPVPAVREQLAAKGYRFEVMTSFAPVASAMHGSGAVFCMVFNKAGQHVDYYHFSGKPENQQFRRDYDEAMAAYKAAQPN